jgi:hypothetical protein
MSGMGSLNKNVTTEIRTGLDAGVYCAIGHYIYTVFVSISSIWRENPPLEEQSGRNYIFCNNDTKTEHHLRPLCYKLVGFGRPCKTGAYILVHRSFATAT